MKSNELDQFQNLLETLEKLKEANIVAKARLREAEMDLRKLGFKNLKEAEEAELKLQCVIEDLKQQIRISATTWENKWKKKFQQSEKKSITSKKKK